MSSTYIYASGPSRRGAPPFNGGSPSNGDSPLDGGSLRVGAVESGSLLEALHPAAPIALPLDERCVLPHREAVLATVGGIDLHKKKRHGFTFTSDSMFIAQFTCSMQ